MKFFIPIFTFLTFWGQVSFALDEQNDEDYSKKLILLPIVYYTPDTRIAAGGLFIKNLWKEKEGYTSSVLGTLSITENKQALASLAPKLYFNGADWDLSGSLFYSYYPNKFYGRGANNSTPTPEPYIENNLLLGVGIGKNIHSNVFIRAGATKDQRKIVDYSSSGLVASELQNSAQDLEVLSTNIGIEWDRRDYPQAPIEGVWYRIIHSWYSPTDRAGVMPLAPFRKIDFDFRHYSSLGPGWGGVLQVFASEEQGDNIPFQYLNSIGGGVRMRGFYSGQFRDLSLGLLQAEVRFAFRPKWLLAFFASTARLGKKLPDLNGAESLYSGGVGVHYILDPENRTKLRLDMGFNGNDRGIYFLIGEAF